MRLRHLKIPFFLAIVVSLCCWCLLVVTFTGAPTTTIRSSKSYFADVLNRARFQKQISPTMMQPQNRMTLPPAPYWRVNSTKTDYECLGWRQTGGCSPDGPREMNEDKPCDAKIEAGTSGYCESIHRPSGQVVRSFQSTCDGMKYGSHFTCSQTGYVACARRWMLTFLSREFLTYADMPLTYKVRLFQLPVKVSIKKRFDLSRGVVMAVYPKVMKSAYAAIRRLRDTGCTLPVELWIRLDEMKLDHPVLKLLTDKYNCFVREILDEAATHFYVKPYAVYHSAFDQVLLLDCDNFVAVDPTYLFDTPEFKETGAMFWPDFWSMRKTIFNIHNNSVLWELLGVPFVDMFEQESGQVLVDRTMSAEPLRNLMFYSFHEPRLIELFDMAWGDKDLFRFAWLRANQPFHMIQKPPGSAGVKHITYDLFCGHTMVQHDPQGNIVFLHRNTYKLTGSPDAPLIWDHIQQFRLPVADEAYDVRGANGGEVFPDFKRCFGKDTAYEPTFLLTPLKDFAFGDLEPSILQYAHEAWLLVPDETEMPEGP
ncbi:hypothetical protein SPRG_16941 [Saprolegnia parasitica CBS 223.65]|uniref:Uncharacterized protein n=1 Tax=Saprolegnia parasitica (strain CBS 223.65) TaxID=695850 RepID=A0A067BSR5_SAPPC|nr:hypothetical protein SPRG_16941 [Saprolegnia parasitica CBS 223.65]KDO17667.1 hypothetical protein SPRG_16941 [Saprolegnia parasitica CBS 223.65]|eukprot:XP_012211627.1 hypothetical protein SPRG_16941 [Saprolegnia parasitica CBS 223.65]